MIKSNSSIYVFPLHPVLNQENTPSFETFDQENSTLLYSSLYENYKEVLEPFMGKINIVFIFDETDRDLIPPSFFNTNTEIFIGNTNKKSGMLLNLYDKYFSKFHNNLIILSDSIGMRKEHIDKYLGLLTIEDEAFVTGRTEKGSIPFIGFNNFNRELFNSIDWDNFEYNSFLQYSVRHDHFLHVVTDHQVIKNLDDFRQLYKELSKKESMSYCSHNMHERFTHLFIEYKDLLK